MYESAPRVDTELYLGWTYNLIGPYLGWTYNLIGAFYQCCTYNLIGAILGLDL